MEQACLMRTTRFRARHHYRNPAWTDEENARAFGLQGRSHEHDFRVVVHVAGPVDPGTGWCCDLSALDGALRGLLRGWDGGDLNRLIPEVSDGTLRPSTENLARWIYENLRGSVGKPAVLLRVEVHESEEVGSVYPVRSKGVTEQT